MEKEAYLFVNTETNNVSNNFDISLAIINKFNSKKLKFYNINNWNDVNELNKKVLPTLIKIIEEENLFLDENQLNFQVKDFTLTATYGIINNKLVILVKYLSNVFTLKLNLEINFNDEDIFLAFKNYIADNQIALELYNWEINDYNQLFIKSNDWVQKNFTKSLIDINTKKITNQNLNIIGIDKENQAANNRTIQLFLSNSNNLIDEILISYKIIATKQEIKAFFEQLFYFELTENNTLNDLRLKLQTKLQDKFKEEKILERVKITTPDLSKKLKQGDKIFTTHKFKITIDNDYEFEMAIEQRLKITFTDLVKSFTSFFQQIFNFKQDENTKISQFLDKVKITMQEKFGKFLWQYLELKLKDPTIIEEKLISQISVQKIDKGELEINLNCDLLTTLNHPDEKNKWFIINFKIIFSPTEIKKRITNFALQTFDYNFNETNNINDLITKIQANIKTSFNESIANRIEIIGTNNQLLHQPYKEIATHELVFTIDKKLTFTKNIKTKIKYSNNYLKQTLNNYFDSNTFDFIFNETNSINDLITKIQANIKTKFSDIFTNRLEINSKNNSSLLHQPYKEIVTHELVFTIDKKLTFTKNIKTKIKYSNNYLKQTLNNYFDSNTFDFIFNETNNINDLITKIQANIKTKFSDIFTNRLEINSKNNSSLLHQPYKEIITHELTFIIDKNLTFIKNIKTKIKYQSNYLKQVLNNYFDNTSFDFNFNETNIINDLITKIQANIKTKFNDIFTNRLEITGNNIQSLHQPYKEIVTHELVFTIDKKLNFTKNIKTKIKYSNNYLKQTLNNYFDSNTFDFIFNETNSINDLITKIQANIKTKFSDIFTNRLEINSKNNSSLLHQPYKEFVTHELIFTIDKKLTLIRNFKIKIAYSSEYITQQVTTYFQSKTFNFNFNETHTINDLLPKIKAEIQTKFSDFIANRIIIVNSTKEMKLNQNYQEVAQHNIQVIVDRSSSGTTTRIKIKINYSSNYIKQELNTYLANKTFDFNLQHINTIGDLITKLNEDLKIKFGNFIFNQINLNSDDKNSELDLSYANEIKAIGINIKVNNLTFTIKVKVKINYPIKLLKELITSLFLQQPYFSCNLNEISTIKDLIKALKEDISKSFDEYLASLITFTHVNENTLVINKNFQEINTQTLTATFIKYNYQYSFTMQIRVHTRDEKIISTITNFCDQVFQFDFDESAKNKDVVEAFKARMKTNFGEYFFRRIGNLNISNAPEAKITIDQQGRGNLTITVFIKRVVTLIIKFQIKFSSQKLKNKLDIFLNTIHDYDNLNENTKFSTVYDEFQRELNNKIGIDNAKRITASNSNTSWIISPNDKGISTWNLEFSIDNHYIFNKTLTFSIKFSKNELKSRLESFLNQTLELDLKISATIKDTLVKWRTKLIDHFGVKNANRITTSRENETTTITPNNKGQDYWNLDFSIDKQIVFNKKIYFQIWFSIDELKSRLASFLNTRFELDISETATLKSSLEKWRIKLTDQFGYRNANRITTNRWDETTKVTANDKGDDGWNLDFYIDKRIVFNKNLDFTVWFTKEFLKDRLSSFLDRRHEMIVYAFPSLKKVLEHFKKLLKDQFGAKNADRITTNRQNDETISTPNILNGEDQWWLEFWVDSTFFYRKNLLIKIILWK